MSPEATVTPLPLATLARDAWDQPGSPLRRPVPPGRPPGDLPALVHRLLLTLHSAGGAGLAANQVGLDLRLAVIDTRTQLPLVLLDPLVLRRSRERETSTDACLSLPGWSGIVERAQKVWLAWTDLQGTRHEGCFSGHLGRIVQHEIDHLDGVVFTQRLVPGTDLIATTAEALAARAMAILAGGAAFVPLPDCTLDPEGASP